jgi:hypothetical protein
MNEKYWKMFNDKYMMMGGFTLSLKKTFIFGIKPTLGGFHLKKKLSIQILITILKNI